MGNPRNLGLTNALIAMVLLGGVGCGSNPNQKTAPVTSSNPSGISQNTSKHSSDSEKSASVRRHQEIRYLTKFISDYHISRPAIDNTLSSKIFFSYLKSLDNKHIYFLKNDIKEFSKIEYSLDNALITGWLKPIFPIHDRLVTLVHERYMYSISLLNTTDFWNFKLLDNQPKELSDWLSDEVERKTIWRDLVRFDISELRKAGLSRDTIKAILVARYHEIIDQQGSVDSDEVYAMFVNAFTSTLDSGTSYYPPRNHKLNIDFELGLVGVGLVLEQQGPYVTVNAVTKGGPAQMSGILLKNDRLVSIEEQGTEPVNVIGMSLEKVVGLLRGKENSIVTIEVKRNDKLLQVPLTRKQVKLIAPKVSSFVVDADQQKVGVIKIPSFYLDFIAQTRGDLNYNSVSRDVREQLQVLINARINGLVIDITGNSGGALSEVHKTAGIFLGEAPILQQKNSDGKVEVVKAKGKAIIFDKPIVVLVDSDTASGGEMFAAAMQDHGKALLVGERTYGRSTIQQMLDLNRWLRSDGGQFGALRITVAEVFRVTGKGIQAKGVTPNFILTSAFQEKTSITSEYETVLSTSEIAAVQQGSTQLDNIEAKLAARQNNMPVSIESSKNLNQPLNNAISLLVEWLKI
ncbi:PDZ domain-containing protein [Aliikangiella marina]|uniref:PDZ domain-containing protein n=1 Tax=Aliikangiella marina TaxID=1712262 RepID=A0A545T6R8_9GAMM|nr:S41 family peptidase [Aliikangiella marina]TQV72916.1 PDZ domain-containing protein [Aliikangiella marina]